MRQFVLVDRGEVAEKSRITAQQHGDQVVEFLAVDANPVEFVARHDEPDPRRVIRLVGQDQVAVRL